MTEYAGDRPEPQDSARATEAARHWLVELCHHHRLSPTQRRVAQSYLDSMPEAAFLSTSEVALRAGVSQATITRFAATLGFATYADFRAALRQVILGRAMPEPAETEPDGSDPVAEAQANLDAVRATLASPAMSAAVARLAGARTLAVIGFRASAALTAYTGYFAGRVLDDVRVLTDADSAFDALAQLGRSAAPGDAAALVFAMPRYPAATVRVLRYARSLGMPTVLVSDSPLVDFAADADHVLVAPVGTGLVFDTQAAPMVLAMALVDGIAATQPRRTQERLEAHESLVDTWVHRPISDPD